MQNSTDEQNQKTARVKRKPTSSYFTEFQLTKLKQYFNEVKMKPSHDEKEELSQKYGIDPFRMNKWFQGERTKINKKLAKKKMEIQTQQTQQDRTSSPV